jgi:hypothetical protein
VSDNQIPRDLVRYLDTYSDLPFEAIQEDFRRRSLIDFLTLEEFSIATEVGCGRSSLFEHWFPSNLAQTLEPIPDLLDGVRRKMADRSTWRGFDSRVEDSSKFAHLVQADVTVVSSLLHEVEKPNEFLQAVRNITKPGGLIVIIVTNKNSLHRILGVHLGLLNSLDQKTSTEIHMQQSHGAYSIAELEIELQKANLDVLHSGTIFPKLFSHKQMSDLIAQNVIDPNFLETMNALSSNLQGFGSEILAVARRKSD